MYIKIFNTNNNSDIIDNKIEIIKSEELNKSQSKSEINNKQEEKEKKDEINNSSSDTKKDIKNNIKEEIKNINEKKIKSKILIKKNKKIEDKTNTNNSNIKLNVKSNNKTTYTKIKRNPNKIMKKSITTYPNKLNSKRKFDPVKFNEYLKGVNDYENKKKQKIENMRKEETEKELKKITNHPKINKGNIKYKINNKNYSTIERLYTQDLIKRKEKKQILTKIYTPTFKPNIYANKIMINKSNQKNLNNLDYSNHYNLRTEINDDENEDIFYNYNENSEFNYNNYD